MEEYTDEDLQTDIKWLGGYDIPSDKAEEFIKTLLKNKLKEEDGMYNILNGFGTDKEEFETYVGRQPKDEAEMDDWINYVENGANAQLDWGVICQCASDNFSKEVE